jgi:hypothetical protein
VILLALVVAVVVAAVAGALCWGCMCGIECYFLSRTGVVGGLGKGLNQNRSKVETGPMLQDQHTHA